VDVTYNFVIYNMSSSDLPQLYYWTKSLKKKVNEKQEPKTFFYFCWLRLKGGTKKKSSTTVKEVFFKKNVSICYTLYWLSLKASQSFIVLWKGLIYSSFFYYFKIFPKFWWNFGMGGKFFVDYSLWLNFRGANVVIIGYFTS
jgi:hypothetical protein